VRSRKDLNLSVNTRQSYTSEIQETTPTSTENLTSPIKSTPKTSQEIIEDYPNKSESSLHVDDSPSHDHPSILGDLLRSIDVDEQNDEGNEEYPPENENQESKKLKI
jgi:hypothetical protein